MHSFLAIRTLALETPYPFINTCLKSTYLTFARNAKFTNPNTADHITFMANCVTELYGLDHVSGYQQAFGFVRQLAIHLRNSLQAKTKEAYAAVYNWQFINCTRVWAQVIAANPQSVEFRDLLYPLVQIITGTVGVVPTARFFPLHFQCIGMLNQLAEATKVYVPAIPLLLDLLSNVNMHGHLKSSKSNKPMDLWCLLKVSYPNKMKIEINSFIHFFF